MVASIASNSFACQLSQNTEALEIETAPHSTGYMGGIIPRGFRCRIQEYPALQSRR